MKIKTLRKKDTKEFVHLQLACKNNEDYMTHCMHEVYTGELPMVLSPNVTRDILLQHYHDVDFTNIELIEFELFEANTVGADIRNKLSPIANLVALLENGVDINAKYVQNEIKQSKISVDYLTNLL